MLFKATVQLQPSVASIMDNYVEKKRLPHALLFSGAADSGQLEAAAELAQVLFCRNADASGYCGSCSDCRQVSGGSHPDHFVLRPEEGHALKVESIREMIARANFKPFQAPAKVLVIDQADRMNDIAQNALLKTLEEPPGNTYIVVISYATEKLLPTIRSRTQTLNFLPLRRDTASDPKIGAARHELLCYLCGEGEWKTADTVSLEREAVLRVLDLLVEDVRHILLLRVDAGHILGLIEDKPLKERALKNFTEEALMDTLEVLSEYKERIMASANLKLALSVLKDELFFVKK